MKQQKEIFLTERGNTLSVGDGPGAPPSIIKDQVVGGSWVEKPPKMVFLLRRRHNEEGGWSASGTEWYYLNSTGELEPISGGPPSQKSEEKGE